MKVAVFQVTNSGEDGRAKTKVIFSSVYETEREKFFESLGKNKGYYDKCDVVLDLAVLGKQFINKLDGNDKMIMDLCLAFDTKENNLSFAFGDINITCYQAKKF
ncbi:MAG: hypothetical protein GY928_03915 [Colwellia sp.]|nr:hypothetical protein [Colwellia sp.]